MQSTTLFQLVRILSKRTILLQSLTQNCINGSAVTAARYISCCKFFPKKYKRSCTVYLPVKRFIETNSVCNGEGKTHQVEENASSSVHKEKTYYVALSNLPFTVVVEDLNEFFADVKMVDAPEILRTELMKPTGQAVLKVADSESVRLCMKKNGTDFLGRVLQVVEENEEKANALLGKTVIKIFYIPYKWNGQDLFEFLLAIGVDKIKELIVIPSNLSTGRATHAGRAYAVFHNLQAKEKAVRLLHLQKQEDKELKYLMVKDSNLLSAYFDRARCVKKKRQMGLFRQEKSNNY